MLTAFLVFSKYQNSDGQKEIVAFSFDKCFSMRAVETTFDGKRQAGVFGDT